MSAEDVRSMPCSAARQWTAETPRAGGWWWLDLGGGRYEAVLVWSPDELQAYDSEGEWREGEWYFESAAWMGWMTLCVTKGLRWAGGPAKSREALGAQPPPNDELSDCAREKP